MTDSSAGATVAAATAVDPAAAVVVGGAVAVAADSDVAAAVVVECGRAPLKPIPKTWRACATRCATSPIRPSA